VTVSSIIVYVPQSGMDSAESPATRLGEESKMGVVITGLAEATAVNTSIIEAVRILDYEI
jgi:hypothetical protein